MNAPAPDDIAKAVLRWQHKHPLAQRLDASAVQGIGLVAMPFVRANEASPAPAMRTPWRRSLDRLLRGQGGSLGQPAFSEDFIDGMSPARAARFALRHGVESIEGAEGWPQRRIGVDSARAEALPGGWPYELWLATAALDGPQGRHRVLVGLSGHPTLAVLGQRQWDLRRLAIAATVALAAVGAVVMALRSKPPTAQAVRVTGAVLSASTPGTVGSAATPASGSEGPRRVTASAASAPSVVSSARSMDLAASAAGPSPSASAPSAASAPASATAPPMEASGAHPVALPPPSEPPIDIRPKLGVIRERSAPRPPIGGGLPPAVSTAGAKAPIPGRVTPPSASPPLAPTAAGVAERASGGTPQPERVSPRWPAPGQPTVALVSNGFAQRADAEAMLVRMREHVSKALQGTETLQGEVFESPEGFRAALYPFGSREEAQVINATMVARGWRTRAVPF